MYSEDELLPLSALQHFIFCRRQCGLIHIEQAWAENLFTAEGRIMHDKVHEEGDEERRGVKIERGLSLRSLELGLSGKADVVEFYRSQDGKTAVPFPVEYKRGKPKSDISDKVQLCAQAICLEEMLKTPVSRGALFYGKTRHRLDIVFDENLRNKTKEAAYQLHEFVDAGVSPPPVYLPKCDSCSFFDMCLPKSIAKHLSIKRYLEEEIEGHEKIS